MLRKRRWAEGQGAQVGAHANAAGGIADARARLQWRKHWYFTQSTAINAAIYRSKGDRPLDDVRVRTPDD